MQMRRRNLTREERARRNLRIAYLIWAVFVIAVLVCEVFDTETAEPEPQPTPVPVVVSEPSEVVESIELTEEEVETILLEDERIEAALIEQGYYRDDIPLAYSEQDFLHTAADQFGIPYELALAVVWKETKFRNVTGDGGDSIGYMQIQPRWHSSRMERLGVSDLSDPYGNFLVGCDYLGEMLAKNRGTEWALMAYNGGATYANKMAKAGKVSQYAKDVLNYMNELGGF